MYVTCRSKYFAICYGRKMPHRKPICFCPGNDRNIIYDQNVIKRLLAKQILTVLVSDTQKYRPDWKKNIHRACENIFMYSVLKRSIFA